MKSQRKESNCCSVTRVTARYVKRKRNKKVQVEQEMAGLSNIRGMEPFKLDKFPFYRILSSQMIEHIKCYTCNTISSKDWTTPR